MGQPTPESDAVGPFTTPSAFFWLHILRVEARAASAKNRFEMIIVLCIKKTPPR
jgi:hypothetical protein